MSTTLLVINPTSGGGRGRKTGIQTANILKNGNVNFQEVIEENSVDARKALKLLLSKVDVDKVILVGGDGIVHLGIQLLANTDIPVLVIPAGTGNDFVRAQNFPLRNISEIIDFSYSNSPKYVDLGIVNGEYFADILSTGFDAIVNERANRIYRIHGPMKYNVAIALELPIFKPQRYRFTIDGEILETQAMLIAVANGNSYGGGMLVCPSASISDGLFDVMILSPISKLEFIKVFPKVFSGKHVTHPAVTIKRCREITIEAEAIAYSDGERIGPLPLTAKIAPKSLLTWHRNP